MKAWELMEQLAGRDPSGQITVHLEGNRRLATDLELSPPGQRKIEIEVAMPDECDYEWDVRRPEGES